MKPIFESLGLRTVGDEPAWAVQSADNQYRYLLGRMWQPQKPQWLWMMLNPSDARVLDDPTIRKVRGFTVRGGGGGFVVCNLLAYSDSRPRMVEQALAAGIDIAGEHNVQAVRWALDVCGPTRIAAWGCVPERLALAAYGARTVFLGRPPGTALCFGRNRDGSPKHPSRIGYDTPMTPLAPLAPP